MGIGIIIEKEKQELETKVFNLITDFMSKHKLTVGQVIFSVTRECFADGSEVIVNTSTESDFSRTVRN